MTRIAEMRGGGIRGATLLRWAAWGIIFLPGVAIAGAPIRANPALVIAVVPWAGLTAYGVRWLTPDSRFTVGLGLAVLAVGAWLLHNASYPGSGYVVANAIGGGAGFLVPRSYRPRWRDIAAIAAVAIALVLVRWSASAVAAGVLSCVIGALATALSLADRRIPVLPARRAALMSGVAALYGVFAVAWVGATAPTVVWFGPLMSHGPSSSNEVALTFDDGPNPPYTEQVAAILNSYGVRGTFFEVGKAVVQAPSTTQKLIQDGDLVGNHSYTHGDYMFLDPSYPELARTQQVLKQADGVCPSVFRPPHGTHTPFMSHVVDDAGMHVITWNVSAKDWSETDPDRLAANIVARSKPGSIILLHDGLNGVIGADRSVLVEALPKILDGLKAKGLKVVRLDELLGIPPSLTNC